ncbi:MAG: sigma-70 family RNA polymerase sigma factor [Bryobacteraceae bacterium]
MKWASADGDNITALLKRVSSGDREAEQALLDRVYPDLHAIARRHFRLEKSAHTLQPTALVNEVYLKVLQHSDTDWKDRAHFFAVASRAMRQVLIDHARRDRSEKRGGGAMNLPLNEGIASTQAASVELIALDEALHALEEINPRLAKVVEYRYFGDMTEQEVAEALGVSTRTVKRDWAFARAWLRDRLIR